MGLEVALIAAGEFREQALGGALAWGFAEHPLLPVEVVERFAQGGFHLVEARFREGVADFARIADGQGGVGEADRRTLAIHLFDHRAVDPIDQREAIQIHAGLGDRGRLRAAAAEAASALAAEETELIFGQLGEFAVGFEVACRGEARGEDGAQEARVGALGIRGEHQIGLEFAIGSIVIVARAGGEGERREPPLEGLAGFGEHRALKGAAVGFAYRVLHGLAGVDAPAIGHRRAVFAMVRDGLGGQAQGFDGAKALERVRPHGQGRGLLCLGQDGAIVEERDRSAREPEQADGRRSTQEPIARPAGGSVGGGGFEGELVAEQRVAEEAGQKDPLGYAASGGHLPGILRAGHADGSRAGEEEAAQEGRSLQLAGAAELHQEADHFVAELVELAGKLVGIGAAGGFVFAAEQFRARVDQGLFYDVEGLVESRSLFLIVDAGLERRSQR